jgi:predicted DNA-binding protein
MSRKHQLCIYLEPNQLARLQELSARSRVPQAFFLREAVDLVLARHEASAPPAPSTPEEGVKP